MAKKPAKKARGPGKARAKRKPGEGEAIRQASPPASGASAQGMPARAGAKAAAKGKKPPKKQGKRKAKGQPKPTAHGTPAAAPSAAPGEPSRAALLTLGGPTGEVLDRLHAVVLSRRTADPAISHSARLLGRGPAKVAQKFGEEAVECLIEAVGGNRDALIGESADVLYHLLVVWVSAGVDPQDVWAELQRREGVSGLAEKASRSKLLPRSLGIGTTKIP